MVEHITEILSVGGQEFQFRLCRKQEQFDAVAVDHWWIDTRRIYGQRNGSVVEGQVITDYFWALCKHHGTALDPEVQESFFLARLVPYARSNGSRRVFADAHVTRAGQSSPTKSEVIAELDQLLRTSRGSEITMAEFKDKTGDLLGPPRYQPEIMERYQQLTADFLGEARAALQSYGTAGIEVGIARWRKLLAYMGRHRGFAVEKAVLDILSYECRAALHRCYSAAWYDLLAHLAVKYRFDQATKSFLHFWHLDHVSEAAQGRDAVFHLFHGHVLALHPASGDFVQTGTGRKLLGAWLARPTSATGFGKLLHGMLVTLCQYAVRNNDAALARRISCSERVRHAAANVIGKRTIESEIAAGVCEWSPSVDDDVPRITGP